MRQPLKAIAVTCALALAGCTAKDAALVPADLEQFQTTAKVSSLWHANLDANARISGIGPFKSGHVYSRPMFGSGSYARFYLTIDGDRLFAATRKGSVYALDKHSGETLWQRKIDADLSAGVSFNNNQLFVATLKGEVLALSANDGKTLWSHVVSTEVIAPPVSNGSEVLVSAIDGRLFALDAKTGERLWNYDHPQPLLTFRAQAKPWVEDRQAYVAFDNGQLLSFGTREGELRWSVRVSQPQGITELERAVDLDASPVVSGPFVLAAGANGRVVAVAKGSGKITWAEDASVFNDLSVSDDTLVYVDENSHLHARTVTAGRELWVSKKLHRRGVSAPAIVGSYVAAVDDSNYLHILNVASGEFSARRALLGNGYQSPMLVEDDVLYVMSDNGALSAYRVAAK